MKNKPKVSVIIPSFNSANYLPQTIESVLHQTYQDFEIILVDDGSTDNISDVVVQYKPHLRFISQENLGPGAARNAGIRVATGEYLVFLDADDILLPEKLDLQASFLDQHPEIGVVFSNVYSFRRNAHGEEKIWPYPTSNYIKRSLGEPSRNLEIFLIQNIFPPIAAMVRRVCVQEVGGFDENRELISLEDWDLWFRLAQEYRFAYLDEFVAKYRVGTSSLSSNRPRMKRPTEILEKKMIDSQSFSSISNSLRSSFYFYWGVAWLDFRKPEVALARFRKAIQCNPKNVLARAAYLLTIIMGENAVVFYHLKRKLFGVR